MARARVAGVLIICMMLLTMVAPQMATAAFNPLTDKPTNLAPYDNATEIGPSHVFSFSYPDPAPETPYAYQIQYRTVTGDYSLPLYSEFVKPTSWGSTVDAAYPQGIFDYGKTYYWHVRVQDNLGNWTGWSDETSFTIIVNSVPSMPQNFEPDDGADGVRLPVTLEASEFRDPNADELVLGEKDTHAASRWQVRISSGDYNSPVFDSGDVATALTSVTVPLGVLSENTTYYWHVKYEDSHDNWSAYSEETWFTTGTTTVADAVEQPRNESPYNGAVEISPDQKLKASAFEGVGEHYASRWQVAASGSNEKNADGSYQQTLFDSSIDPRNKVETAMPVGLLDYGETYYWHVKYQDDTGAWSAWSEETSFTVVENLPPSQPQNTSPVDGAEDVSAPVVLKASGFADPDTSAYTALTDAHAASQWQVTDKAGDYSDPVWDSDEANPTTLASVPKGVLLAGSTYYWHVRYQDSRDNWSGYSAETSFTTKSISMPVAWFLADTTDLVAGEELAKFTDNSTPIQEIDRWVWDFGDGASEDWTYDTRPPNGEITHKYTTGGTYIVKLTVYNGASPDGESKTVSVVVHAKPEASFTSTPAAPKAGKEITFTDASAPTADIDTWEWYFDDGTTVKWTAADRPQDGVIKHAFKKAGPHTVTLTVEGPLGRSVYNKQVNVASTGGFQFGLWMIAAAVALVVVIAGVVYLVRARRAK